MNQTMKVTDLRTNLLDSSLTVSNFEKTSNPFGAPVLETLKEDSLLGDSDEVSERNENLSESSGPPEVSNCKDINTKDGSSGCP